jgi:hypothetical protein
MRTTSEVRCSQLDRFRDNASLSHAGALVRRLAGARISTATAAGQTDYLQLLREAARLLAAKGMGALLVSVAARVATVLPRLAESWFDSRGIRCQPGCERLLVVLLRRRQRMAY